MLIIRNILIVMISMIIMIVMIVMIVPSSAPSPLQPAISLHTIYIVSSIQCVLYIQTVVPSLVDAQYMPVVVDAQYT